MYAIVEIAGHQYKVQKDQRIFVNRLEAKEGDNVEFDNVLLTDNDGKVNVGAPAIDGAKVTGKVVEHRKGDKVVVFKKKRRKGYKVKNGHRQLLTQVQIDKIEEKGAKKGAATAKKSTAKDSGAASTKKTETEEKASTTKSASKSSGAKKAESASKTGGAKKSTGSASEKKKTETKSTTKKSTSSSKSSKSSSSSSKKSGGDEDKKES